MEIMVSGETTSPEACWEKGKILVLTLGGGVVTKQYKFYLRKKERKM